MNHHDYLGALASCVRDGLITFTEFAHDLRCNEYTILRLDTSTDKFLDAGELREVDAPYVVAIIKPNESDEEFIYAVQTPTLK